MTGTTADTTIRLTRRFRAPRERVWRAFTEPEALQRWYAPVEGWTIPLAEVDLRVGGRYRVQMQPPGREPMTEEGEYLEIVPGERIVCRIGIAGEATRLTVTFRDLGDQTEVQILEEGYSSPAIRDRHLGGWTHMLGVLHRYLGA